MRRQNDIEGGRAGGGCYGLRERDKCAAVVHRQGASAREGVFVSFLLFWLARLSAGCEETQMIDVES